MRSHFEVIIVGGGIAGASLAYFLGERGVADVLLLERETQPGYHASGRSAALLCEIDPIPLVQQLKVLGGAFLRRPPAGFSDTPLLDPTGIMLLFQGADGRAPQGIAATMERMGVRAEVLERAAVVERVPPLEAKELDGALWLPDDGHIDVHALLWGYLRHAKRRGAVQQFGAEVLGVRVEGGRCVGVETNAGTFHGRWVVDAAGAWAGKVAALAQASPIAVVPHRRTIVTFAPPADLRVDRWPLVESDAHSLYFAPESGGLLLSPMDEEAMEPCDAHPAEEVIAAVMERLAVLAPRLVPRAIRHRWAGLRTFAPDRVPVVGEDPRRPGFFWLAGQGGFGIESSGIIGAIAADLIVDGKTARFDASALAPGRFGEGHQ